MATDNFSVKSRLESSVYRGILAGEEVAIKKMNTNISKEFMENGCLKNWLRNKKFPFTQSWSQMIQIALDIAKGLHYFHNFTNPACVHKNINSRNILLGRNVRAKIVTLVLQDQQREGKMGLLL
ncbi:hypothetical protein MKX01_038997 [Papaver californicum]|nr:hypothetical protein MKX01_038997 [Papaver californicum]